MRHPKVTVLVLFFNKKKFIKKNLISLAKQTYKNLKVYVLDNSLGDQFNKIISNFEFKISNLSHIHFNNNLGYANANHVGLKKAFNEGADFCLVLNDDTFLEKDTIAKLVACYQEKIEKNIKVGLIQPVILLAEEKTKINTLGNAIHYLGFGYCQDFFKKYQVLKKDKEIISASGAAMLISRNYYENVGGFDDNFFMYGEDEDLSWRGLLAGYHHFLSSSSILYHHYQFARHKLNKYYEEKNRLIILLKNYSTKSLVLLTPILVFNELGLLFYSLFEGWFFLKLKTYGIVFLNLKNILKKRRIIQTKRVVEDKYLFLKFKATIYFKPINNFVIRYLVNPVYWLYYQLICLLI